MSIAILKFSMIPVKIDSKEQIDSFINKCMVSI